MRFLSSGASTLVAVFFPEREGQERFKFLLWDAGTWGMPDGLDVGDATPIGVVADMMPSRTRALSLASRIAQRVEPVCGDCVSHKLGA